MRRGTPMIRPMVALVLEAHPVGVVQHACPAQRLDQVGGTVEAEWPGFDTRAKGVGALQGVSQRAHTAPRV